MDHAALLEIALRRGFTRDQVAATLRQLDDEQVERLAWAMRWADTRHQHQVVPADEDGKPWSVWLILGGRGAGKTRVGAEWLGMAAATTGLDAKGKVFRGLISAPTKTDLREVCIEGESGLLSVIPTSLVADYNKNNNKIVLHNGSILGGISAETSSRFRGPQWHKAWADELAAWGDNGRDPQDAWDTMAMSVRLGHDTRILATTTPRPLPHIKALLADPSTVVSTASTYVNLENLSGEFAKRILKYEGSLIGRQEIHAEMIDAEESGIIQRSWLRKWPGDKALPAFEYIVMSLDTAFSEESFDKKKGSTDPTACTVWGVFKHKLVPSIMLLDSWAEKLSFPDLVDRVKTEKKVKYGATDKRPIIGPYAGKQTIGSGKSIDVIVIEEKASGKSLRQQLERDGIRTFGFNPGNADKLTRLHIVSPLAVDRRVWIPESLKKPGTFMSWAMPMIEEVCSYHGPGTTLHDDYVDSLTQAWRIMDNQSIRYLDLQSAKKTKKIIDTDDIRSVKKPPVNPYSE